MATSSMHPCAKPFCKTLVPRGQARCDLHTRERALAYEETRGTSTERGYDKRWRIARNAFLLEHEYCVMCLAEGRVTKATDVDHVQAHRGDPVLFWDELNWQALCHAHHSRKTAREDGRWSGAR